MPLVELLNSTVTRYFVITTPAFTLLFLISLAMLNLSSTSKRDYARVFTTVISAHVIFRYREVLSDSPIPYAVTAASDGTVEHV